jgi:hypothetical protein
VQADGQQRVGQRRSGRISVCPDGRISRIGRSPDFASAFVLALKDSPKRAVMDRFTRAEREKARRARLDYIEDPFAPATSGRKEHDPFAYLN